MTTAKQHREAKLTHWARDALSRRGLAVPSEFVLRPVSDDASFRRYFRAVADEKSFIFVDAPPELEDSRPFVAVAAMLRRAGVNAPAVLEQDLSAGFMMLTDFGDRLYAHALAEGDSGEVERLYDDAFETLARMQAMNDSLPPYDETRLRDEMNLFTEWFLSRQLRIDIDRAEARMIEGVLNNMVESALSQPQVFVHRDYHCRNLMVVEEDNPGVIDFQDAVIGPITYDLVSLLRDCYHRFDAAFIERRVEAFRLASGQDATSPAEFRRWFDWMGMQRHLKVAGIFSRLNLRDGKPRYLDDIPLVVTYLVEVASAYPELQPFGEWLGERVVPRMKELAAS